MKEALIGMGGNIGDAVRTLDAAVPMLCDDQDVVLFARSSTYMTAPWGVVDQPEFANLCLRVRTRLKPRGLLQRALEIERRFGRDRSRETRWGPRILDIDLLAYEGSAIDAPHLKLPHPRIAERAFVLVPLAEIAPDWTIAGVTVAALAERVDQKGLRKVVSNSS